jgi:uncharacterized membrane protein
VRKIGFFIKFCCVFAIGCSFGWIIEVIFRRFWSGNNRERRWINPGYLCGPWLPVYGFGLCALYLLSGIEYLLPVSGVLAKVLLIIIMTISVTAVELLAGLLSVNILKANLWDYSGEWGNYKGLICPRFAFFWGIICSLYLLLLHRPLLSFTDWIAHHSEFSVFIGIYLGLLFADALGLNLSRGKNFFSILSKIRSNLLKST